MRRKKDNKRIKVKTDTSKNTYEKPKIKEVFNNNTANNIPVAFTASGACSACF